MSDSDIISIVATALFAVSEALSLIPGVKANSIFQFLVQVIKTLTGK